MLRRWPERVRMTVKLYVSDLPAGLDFGDCVAVDSETLGLNPLRDRLCLIQLSAGDGDAHLVQFERDNYAAPNLKALLAAPEIVKLFHFARFDVAVIQHYLGVKAEPVYCTKIAVTADPDLHRPPRPQGSLRRNPWSHTLETTAILGLGHRNVDSGAARLRGRRRPLSSRPQGASRHHARPRWPNRAGRGLFRISVDARGTRFIRLGGHRYIFPFGMNGRPGSDRQSGWFSVPKVC